MAKHRFPSPQFCLGGFSLLSVGPMVLYLGLVLAPISLLAQGQDARGSSDHPVLSIYPGSRIQTYGLVAFDQYPLALGVENNRPANIQRIEVTKIGYVNPTGRSALDEVAQLLKNQPTSKLMVVGHTDSTGDLDMNMKLSSDRAGTVVKALTMTYNITTTRLSHHGCRPPSRQSLPTEPMRERPRTAGWAWLNSSRDDHGRNTIKTSSLLRRNDGDADND